MQEKEEIEKLRNDKFALLEHGKKDKAKGEAEKGRIAEIINYQEKWKDDYEINSLLRKKFRAEKKDFAAKEEEEKKPKNFALKIQELKPEDIVKKKKIDYFFLKG